jgi:hypothetical protein
MTKLLEMAFTKASGLAEAQQNALARWLLEEFEAQTEWQDRSAEPDDVLGYLTHEILKAHREGRISRTSFGCLPNDARVPEYEADWDTDEICEFL